MSSELIINSRSYETRVALVENGIVVELHIERDSGRELMGNIYRGRVVRVLPGMQAAFVDIGIERAAFLYVADVGGKPGDLSNLFYTDTEEQARDLLRQALSWTKRR
jgi:ribonuclease G